MRRGRVQPLDARETQAVGGAFATKIRVLRQEGGDAVLVLLAQQRAGDIDQATAGFDMTGAPRQNLVLRRLPLLQRAGTRAPFGVRVAPPGPDPVQGASMTTRSQAPARSATGSFFPRGARTSMFFAPARSRRAKNRREPAPVGIGGEQLAAVVHRRRERKRLAAAARAKVQNLFARRGAAQGGGELRALVLNFHHAPGVSRLGVERGAASRRALRDAQAERRETAGLRAQMREFGEHFRPRGLQRVDPQVERRAGGQRPALRDRALAKGARKMRRQPFGIVAQHPVRRVRQGFSRARFWRSSSLSGAGAWPMPEKWLSISSSVMSRAKASAPIISARGVSAFIR